MNSIEDDLSEFAEEFSSETDMITIIPEKSTKINYAIVTPEHNQNTDIEPFPRVFNNHDFVNDFIQVKESMTELIEGCKTILRKITVNNCISKPSMITAIAQLNNAINGNGKLLIELHEKIFKFQKDHVQMNDKQNPESLTVNNITNNLTVNTKDLNGIIEELIKKGSD